MRRWALVLTVLLGATAHAHVASNGFLAVSVDGHDLHGSVELAVRDVELAVGTGAGPDGKVTWGELKSAERRLDEYLAQHLAMSAQGHACPVTLEAMQLNDRVDGTYVWLPFSASCAVAIESLAIRYTVLEQVDPSHRGLLTLTAGTVAQTGVLGGQAGGRVFAVHAPAAWRTFLEYLRAGVWHIWSGIDHLLFLLSLLLPAVLLRRGAHWEPVARARPALVSILKVVTAFTIAHSITLTLAALDVVRLPSRLTESVIAASIIVAALNNIFPVVTECTRPHRLRLRPAARVRLRLRARGDGAAAGCAPGVTAGIQPGHRGGAASSGAGGHAARLPDARKPVLPPGTAALGIGGHRLTGPRVAGAAGASAHRLVPASTVQRWLAGRAAQTSRCAATYEQE